MPGQAFFPPMSGTSAIPISAMPISSIELFAEVNAGELDRDLPGHLLRIPLWCVTRLSEAGLRGQTAWASGDDAMAARAAAEHAFGIEGEDFRP